ncbi:MAG: HEPN domain-containing protein [Bryobacteraceae bacterium]
MTQARNLMEQGVFCYATFFAEQAAQKALKAVLLAQGARLAPLHSVSALLEQAAQQEPRLASLVNAGKRLDRHYLTARYPDALPEPLIPADAYLREDAEEAVAAASAIVEAARAAVGEISRAPN